MVTSKLLMSAMTNRKATPDDPIKKIMTREYRKMSSEMPLHELSRVLERHYFVFVDETYVVSTYDVLDFMRQNVELRSGKA